MDVTKLMRNLHQSITDVVDSAHTLPKSNLESLSERVEVEVLTRLSNEDRIDSTGCSHIYKDEGITADVARREIAKLTPEAVNHLRSNFESAGFQAGEGDMFIAYIAKVKERIEHEKSPSPTPSKSSTGETFSASPSPVASPAAAKPINRERYGGRSEITQEKIRDFFLACEKKPEFSQFLLKYCSLNHLIDPRTLQPETLGKVLVSAMQRVTEEDCARRMSIPAEVSGAFWALYGIALPSEVQNTYAECGLDQEQGNMILALVLNEIGAELVAIEERSPTSNREAASSTESVAIPDKSPPS